MLFQPTQITPSLLAGGEGNGTVDITKPLTVSWQVNGNSPMIAYRIEILENSSAYTELYSTGRISQNCPFYGISYDGTVQLFEHTIPASDLAGTLLANGKEYKLVITQWWSETESVTLSSAAVFITRSTPTVSLVNFSSSISTRSAVFEGQYTQAQGDALMWVRWQLAAGQSGAEILYDSHNIYGTAELRMQYDGFFTGGTYSVCLTVETINGIIATTGWKNFTVQYDEDTLSGFVNARCRCKEGGVLLEWSNVLYIEGYPTANTVYQKVPNGIELTAGGITWDEVTGAEMNSPVPWTLIYSFRTVQDALGIVMRLAIGNYNYSFRAGSNKFEFRLGNRILASFTFQKASVPRQFLVILTQDYLSVRTVEMTGGLYPALDLYPSENLYPRDDALLPETGIVYSMPIDHLNDGIMSITINATQICNFIDIEKVQYTADEINKIMSIPSYKPSPVFDENKYFFTDFSNGLSAGNITSLGEQLEGFAIYRRRQGESIIRHIADLPLNQTKLIDFGVVSQSTYTYYMYTIGQSSYVTAALQSNIITPVFWDWELLSCYMADDGRYRVSAVYRFGKNLSTGEISNNNSPSLFPTFTPYPLIQPTMSNYKSGSLSSLIGTVKMGKYNDSISLREELSNLSVTKNTLFLKSRKGDIWQIRPTQPISFSTWDNTRQQAQTISLSWTETADAGDAVIISTSDNEQWSTFTQEETQSNE